jgi:serine/threonine protein kinase
MAEQGKPRRERDAHSPADGGAAVRTPSSGSGSSASDIPPPDAPTLVPGSGSGSDAPTLVPLTHLSPSQTPTIADGMTPPPRRSPRTQGFYTPQPVLETGAVLAQRYEIMQTLGEGGMGAVYKARDLELDRLVALKVIRPELAKNHAIIERFKQELLLSQRVTHRNVIRIYDLGEGDGVKFITMEFIEGQDLRSLIFEKKKLPPEESVAIMEQVCLALDAAHSVGVIHRDLKPQNIMRDHSGRILVMDFGLARTLEGDGMTQTGALVGTMEYMSPEQALAKELDQRSDIFSAGLIFYELLSGQMPFRAESALASLIKRTQERARPISDHDNTIPQNLAAIVSKCLEREPSARYQSAKELLADLEAWQGKRAAGAIAFQAVKPWGQTVPWQWLGGAAAVLVLAVVGYTFRASIFSPSTSKKTTAVVAESLAILPFHNASGDPSLDWLGSSLEEMLTTDVGQSSSLRTVSPNRLYQVLSDLHVAPASVLDPANVRRLAEFSNADMVVWGQYAKFGDQIRIDATLQDFKHERSTTLKAEASNQNDVLAAIDRLSQSIRESLKLSPELIKELQGQSFKPSSKSLDALRFYNDGTALTRQGNNQGALAHFQDSVKADPEFALAYARLGQTYANLGYDNEAEQAARHAMDLSGNLPAREKYLISANYARVLNDNTKAIEAYENLVKVSPDDGDLLFDLAGLYSSTSTFDKARALYRKLLDRDPKNVEVLLALGRLEIRSDNAAASLDYLNRALTLAIQLDNQEERAAVLNAMGVAYKNLNKFDEAARNLQDALAIRRQLGQKKGMAISLNELAQVQESLGKPEASLASYQEALQLRRDIGDKKGVGDTLIDLGGHYQDAGRYDEALKLYKESLQIQRDVGNEDYQALCLNNIGLAYLSQGDYDNARTYFEQALQLRQKFKVPGDTADTLHNLAETSAKTGQFDKALDQYLQALQLYRSADDKAGAAREAYSMGTIFEFQGRYGAALSSKQDALKAFQELQDRSFWMGAIQGGYGHALALAGRGEEASTYFDQALSLARTLKNQPLIAETLNFQGDSQFFRGDLKGARRLYELASQAAAHGKDRSAVLQSNVNLLKVDVTEHPAKAAGAKLKSLAQEADTLGLKYLSLEASLDLAETELSAKDYAHAKQDLERTLLRTDKLGLRALSARGQYLLGTALRLSGNANDASLHYKQAVSLLEQIAKDPGADKALQRSDLNSIYTESSRWSSPKA